MSSPVRQYQPIAQPPVRHAAVSEATKVEQSRAVAEVQAAVLVAQQNRRIKDIAISEMRDSTAQKSVAEKAFFRFPRADGVVTGPSIHLARELARCWGNIDYGIKELRRDDDKAESEMLAYAWDLETNAKNATSFIVPHKRDTKRGVKQLTDMRDIYENNANAGARRVRECIFAVLPAWFKDEAIDRCNQTIEHGGGVPLPQRIANSIEAFEKIGVTRKQLETKVGSKSSDWTAHDLSQLVVIYQSIQNGEINKTDEFEEPEPTVDAASVRGRRKPAAGKAKPDEVKDDESVQAAADAQAEAPAPAAGQDGESAEPDDPVFASAEQIDAIAELLKIDPDNVPPRIAEYLQRQYDAASLRELLAEDAADYLASLNGEA